jgi:hypothetical protein
MENPTPTLATNDIAAPADKKPLYHPDIYAKCQTAYEEYIIQFKNDIQSKIRALEVIHSASTEAERDKIRELMEYIYEYPKLVINKQPHAKPCANGKLPSASQTKLEPDQICIAKRSDGQQCTRKKKKNCDFCGTHAKIVQMQAEKQTTSDAVAVHKMEISAEDIHGIIYYIDKYNNVYHTEDVLEGVENPRIIAKATKHGNNSYTIPELFE